MNLIVDIGNTRIKFSVFNLQKEQYSTSESTFSSDKLRSILKKYPNINKCIISTTGHNTVEVITQLRNSIDFCLEFNHTTILPFKTLYTTPETLGLDRLAGVAGANFLYPKQNVLIIDTGTAITYDLKNEKGEHLGGNISPGMQMRFKALNTFTENLPLVELSSIIEIIGKSTNDAILCGVINGIVAEMDGFIELMQKNYNNLTVILTGGDALFFVNKLKKTIFVVQNLVSTGLNTILSHNVANN